MNTQQQSPFMRLWALGENHHGKLIFAILLAVTGVSCNMIAYFSVAKIIIALISGEVNFSFYLNWCLIALVSYTIRVCLYTLALSFSHQATFSILQEIRQKMIHMLTKLPMGTLVDTSTGELKQIIVDQVESMEVPLAHLLPEMTSNIIGPLFIIIYLFTLDWRMALITLITFPVAMVFMSGMMKDYATDYEGSVKTTTYMNSTIVEYINGIEVIKAYNQGKNSYQKYADAIKGNAAYYYNWMKKCQFFVSCYNAILPSTLITVLPLGLLFYLHGSLSSTTFITTIILALGIAGPLIAAINFTDSLAKVGTIVNTIDSILLAKVQQHGETPVTLTNHEINFEHVSFNYHHDGPEILHDVNFAIKPRTMTALVGPSGSGKSTIAKLIAGFWDANKGDITLGGINLKDIPLTQLNEQIAYVSQDNYLFDDTIMENIRMGNEKASDSEVISIAKEAGCDEFIRRLEHGYQTTVGGGGAHLSGGERQRIAIARALLKNAPIVILDEATAYIDPENEILIQRAMAKLVQGKTLIVIAHRLSTITEAEQILVIKDGSVLQKGTHDSLLHTCPLYKTMWEAHIDAKDGEQSC